MELIRIDPSVVARKLKQGIITFLPGVFLSKTQVVRSEVRQLKKYLYSIVVDHPTTGIRNMSECSVFHSFIGNLSKSSGLYDQFLDK